MKKLLAYGLGSAVALSSVCAFAAEDAEPAGKEINYGIYMTADGQEVTEGIRLVTNGDAASASLYVSVKEGEEDVVEVDIPDYVLQVGEDGYLNASSLIGVAEQLTGMTGLADMVSAFGVTEDWIKLAPIDTEALATELKPYEGAMPEFNEEMIGEASGIAMSLLKVDFGEDGMTYSISSDSLKASAGALDEFKEKNLGFVGDMLTYAMDVFATSASVDLKPAIRGYLDAAGAGYAEANGVSEEEGITAVESMYDMIVPPVMEQFAEQLQAVPVADMWNSFSCAQLAEQMPEFDAKLIMNDEGTSVELTVAGTTITGDVQTVEDGVVINLSQDETELGSIVLMAETDEVNTFSITAMDPAGEVLGLAAVEATVDGDNVDSTFVIEIPSQEVSMSAYLDVTDWVDDGSLATPAAANDVLDVVKNVAAMVFAPSAE